MACDTKEVSNDSSEEFIKLERNKRKTWRRRRGKWLRWNG
jgi:hypothetical protein